MGYDLLINRIYLGYNPLTNHLLTSWDIQVRVESLPFSCHRPVDDAHVHPHLAHKTCPLSLASPFLAGWLGLAEKGTARESGFAVNVIYKSMPQKGLVANPEGLPVFSCRWFSNPAEPFEIL